LASSFIFEKLSIKSIIMKNTLKSLLLIGLFLSIALSLVAQVPPPPGGGGANGGDPPIGGGVDSNLNILLVNDNGYNLTRVDKLKTSLTNLGYSYTFFDTPSQGAPTLALLEAHSLVIWYTGNDGSALYFWNANDTDNQDIKDYIDGDGMLWLQGRDFLYDRYGGAPDSFVAGDFVYDYLGIEEYFAQSHVDDGTFSDGVPQFDVVPGNGIFTYGPISGIYSTFWYADALLPVTGADSVYRMGPAGYDFDDYYSAMYYEKGSGKILSFAFDTYEVNSQTNLDTVFSQGLQYFEQFASSVVYVTDITVSGNGGATTIDVNQGTLQMEVDVQPPDATTSTVLWSVVDGTTTASIDQNGLLQATGTTFGNGTVWVKAAAIDGSGVVDSLEITISNQGSEFEVLLVNDNDYTDRYKEIDSTLTNLGISYDIYHTGATGTFPDLVTLSYYDVVIWYTGNDGVGLKLWDLSDPADYKFNAPLISYLDVGGVVWLQGLDFFYDIFGAAPDTLQPGQFIYDYMGVKTYAVQSHQNGDATGVSQLDKEAGNPDPICTFTPIEWSYSSGYLWNADGLEITLSASGVYRMGPPGYMFDSYLTGVYNVKDYSKILTFAFETARIDTEEHTDTLFSQVLTYFENITGGGIEVTDITVSGDGGATTIDVNQGTLQMIADVQPTFATNKVVYWSVTEGTGTATIDQNGILQAAGFSYGNGTVWVKATATDGSGVTDSLEITISNQGADFEVLLVNDNNWGSTRYQVIDTTLAHLGYTYGLYNTDTEGDYPDYDRLSSFDVVIWYTGNDGGSLKLWDESDPSDYKFNAPLKEYVDNGGIVWLQGLDFLYDIYGSAPDTMHLGQFIHDYMGIKTYYAQSYADDGNAGVTQFDVVPGNPLCTFTPMEWTYAAMNFADALEITDNAQGIYTMGPTGYDFDAYYSGVYNVYGKSKIFSLATETARLNSQANTDTFFGEVLGYFETIADEDVIVDLTVNLEGPFNGTDMNASLLGAGIIPLEQPYNQALPYYNTNVPKWLFSGPGSVSSIPANVVDWVYIELRDANAPENATSQTYIGSQVAFLLTDGSVVDLDGSSLLVFPTTVVSQDLYAVVYHRNHLGIMSNTGLLSFGGINLYDFTTGSDKVFGGINGYKEIGTNVWGMVSSDGNASGIVDNTDETSVWKPELGNSGYLGGDFDLNGIIQNTDETSYWKPNLNIGGQVPGKSASKPYSSQIPE
jgi:hypothetical protein